MFKQKKVVTMAMALILVAAAVTLFSALGGGFALAAKGGKGKGRNGGGTTTTSATLTVTPNPVPLGSQSVQMNGSGFAANEQLGVTISGVCCAVPATADGSGAFSVTFYRDWNWPGTYTVNAYSASGLRATTTFTVQ